MDDNRQRTWGRIGGLTAWSRNEPETMVGPAHRGFRRRFERLVDPDNRLEPAERELRAERARRAHMLTLAAKSAAVRKKKDAAQVQSPAASEREGTRDAPAAA
jgi:hypothetical protein